MSVSVCRIFCRGRGRAHAIDGVDKTQRWSWAFVVLYSRQNLIYSFVFLFDMKSRTTLSELHPLTTYASFLRIDISSRCNCSDPIHLHLQRCSCGDDWGTYGLGCKFRMDWRRNHCNEKSGKRLGPMSCCRYVPDRYFGRSREETGMSFQEKPNLLGVNLLFRDNLVKKRLNPKWSRKLSPLLWLFPGFPEIWDSK